MSKSVHRWLRNLRFVSDGEKKRLIGRGESGGSLSHKRRAETNYDEMIKNNRRMEEGRARKIPKEGGHKRAAATRVSCWNGGGGGEEGKGRRRAKRQ